MTVAIIPLLKGPHQDTVLQVLVSLAVGTLVGDALIHLLPHALLTDHGDTGVVWKGFAATITILCFYVMDRVLESLGQGHSHAPVEQLSDQSSDVENLTVTTSASRDSSPVSKVIIQIFFFWTNNFLQNIFLILTNIFLGKECEQFVQFV